MKNVGNLNDEGSICFLTDPDNFTTQEGVCPTHTGEALRGGNGTFGEHMLRLLSVTLLSPRSVEALPQAYVAH